MFYITSFTLILIRLATFIPGDKAECVGGGAPAPAVPRLHPHLVGGVLLQVICAGSGYTWLHENDTHDFLKQNRQVDLMKHTKYVALVIDSFHTRLCP